MIKILLLLFIASPLFSWTLRVEPTSEGLQFRRLIDTFYPQEVDFDLISYGEYEVSRLASFIYLNNKTILILNDDLKLFNLSTHMMYYYWCYFETILVDNKRMIFHLIAKENDILRWGSVLSINNFIRRNQGQVHLSTFTFYR